MHIFKASDFQYSKRDLTGQNGKVPSRAIKISTGFLSVLESLRRGYTRIRVKFEVILKGNC